MRREPIYTEHEKGQREALLSVRTFIANHGKDEVDAFCQQSLHNLAMDCLPGRSPGQAALEAIRELGPPPLLEQDELRLDILNSGVSITDERGDRIAPEDFCNNPSNENP